MPNNIDLALLKRECDVMITLDEAFNAFNRDQIGITRKEWNAIAAKLCEMAREIERLKNNPLEMAKEIFKNARPLTYEEAKEFDKILADLSRKALLARKGAGMKNEGGG